MNYKIGLAGVSALLAFGDSGLALPTKVEDGTMTTFMPTASAAAVWNIMSLPTQLSHLSNDLSDLATAWDWYQNDYTSKRPEIFGTGTEEAHPAETIVNGGNAIVAHHEQTSTSPGFIGVTTLTATFMKSVRTTQVDIQACNGPFIAAALNPSPSTTCTVAWDCWSLPNHSGQPIDNKQTPFVPGVASGATVHWRLHRNETAPGTDTGVVGTGTAPTTTHADSLTTTDLVIDHTPVTSSEGEAGTVAEFQVLYSSGVIVTVTADTSTDSTSDMSTEFTIDPQKKAVVEARTRPFPSSILMVNTRCTSHVATEAVAETSSPAAYLSWLAQGTQIEHTSEATVVSNISPGTAAVEAVIVTTSPDASTSPTNIWSDILLPWSHLTKNATVEARSWEFPTFNASSAHHGATEVVVVIETATATALAEAVIETEVVTATADADSMLALPILPTQNHIDTMEPRALSDKFGHKMNTSSISYAVTETVEFGLSAIADDAPSSKGMGSGTPTVDPWSHVVTSFSTMAIPNGPVMASEEEPMFSEGQAKYPTSLYSDGHWTV